MKMRIKNKGFTLIEVLVVIFIMSLILSIVIMSGRSFSDSVNLDNASKNIESKIKLAKMRSIGAYNQTNYGVHFESGRVVVFAGDTYVDGAPTNEVLNLPGNIEIYSINLAGGGSDMIFNRLTGETSYYGTVGVRTANDISKTRQINVNFEGQGSFNSFQSSSVSPIVNARHVHFSLGWNIQNATILRLEWLDGFGNPTITTNVDTIPYFNGDKTIFDWEGATTVSGAAQNLRIHSWLDGSNNTVLCVMRDQTESQKLNIYFVDGIAKEIAAYVKNADGTVTVTPNAIYGGTMEIQ